jgi:hypothetical protein
MQHDRPERRMIDPMFSRRMKTQVKTICATPGCTTERMPGLSYCRLCKQTKDTKRRQAKRAHNRQI